MSGEALIAVWYLETRLTSSEKLLLLALANEADLDGEIAGKARRSQRWLAQQCGWNREETVRLNLRSLETKGALITKEIGAGRKLSTFSLPFVAQFVARLRPNSPPPQRGAQPTNERNGEGAAPKLEPPPSTLFSTQEEQPFAREQVDEWFERVFWPKYPVKNRRDAALGALRAKAKTRAQLEEIAAGLEHWIAAELAARASSQWFQRWPNPNTWLAQARWRDRFDVPRETSRLDVCTFCGKPAVASCSGRAHCNSRACTDRALYATGPSQ